MSLLLRSLWAHPRIHYLTFSCPRYSALPATSKTSMMNALLRMLQCNSVVKTLDWFDNAKDRAIFQNSIVPRLKMNRNYFEDQRQALTRADPSIRGQLLGRALHVVRYNPDLLFRFVSENVPAFVRSDQLVGRAFHFVRYNPDLLFRSISDNVPAFFNWTRMVLYSCCCCSIGRG